MFNFFKLSRSIQKLALVTSRRDIAKLLSGRELVDELPNFGVHPLEIAEDIKDELNSPEQTRLFFVANDGDGTLGSEAYQDLLHLLKEYGPTNIINLCSAGGVYYRPFADVADADLDKVYVGYRYQLLLAHLAVFFDKIYGTVIENKFPNNESCYLRDKTVTLDANGGSIDTVQNKRMIEASFYTYTLPHAATPCLDSGNVLKKKLDQTFAVLRTAHDKLKKTFLNTPAAKAWEENAEGSYSIGQFEIKPAIEDFDRHRVLNSLVNNLFTEVRQPVIGLQQYSEIEEIVERLQPAERPYSHFMFEPAADEASCSYTHESFMRLCNAISNIDGLVGQSGSTQEEIIVHRMHAYYRALDYDKDSEEFKKLCFNEEIMQIFREAYFALPFQNYLEWAQKAKTYKPNDPNLLWIEDWCNRFYIYGSLAPDISKIARELGGISWTQWLTPVLMTDGFRFTAKASAFKKRYLNNMVSVLNRLSPSSLKKAS